MGKNRQRLLAPIPAGAKEERRERCLACFQFLDSIKAEDWATGLTKAESLRSAGVAGFELDRLTVLALRGVGRLSEALSLVLTHVQKLASGRMPTIREMAWIMTEALDLALVLARNDIGIALLPLAESVSGTVNNSRLNELISKAQAQLAS